MPNKKLLIFLGLSLLILVSAIVYREVREEEIPPEVVLEEEVPNGDAEEIRPLFDTVEEKFFTLTRNIYLLGDEKVERLEEDLVQIEKKINSAKEELDKEETDTKKVHEYLSEVQEMIGQLSEKLADIEEQ